MVELVLLEEHGSPVIRLDLDISKVTFLVESTKVGL